MQAKYFWVLVCSIDSSFMLRHDKVQITILGVGVDFLGLFCRKSAFHSMCLREIKSTGRNKSSEHPYQIKLLQQLICYFKHFNAGHGNIYILISRAWSDKIFVSLWEGILWALAAPAHKERHCAALSRNGKWKFPPLSRCPNSHSLCTSPALQRLLLSSLPTSLHPIYYSPQIVNA